MPLRYNSLFSLSLFVIGVCEHFPLAFRDLVWLAFGLFTGCGDCLLPAASFCCGSTEILTVSFHPFQTLLLAWYETCFSSYFWWFSSLFVFRNNFPELPFKSGQLYMIFKDDLYLQTDSWWFGLLHLLHIFPCEGQNSLPRLCLLEQNLQDIRLFPYWS